MRQSISLLAACSGFVMATAWVMPLPMANATETKAEDHFASMNLEPRSEVTNQTKVVCSRNRPLSLVSEGTKVASGIGPQITELPSNVIKLFCRDIRINTILVRDYCALIRQ